MVDSPVTCPGVVSFPVADDAFFRMAHARSSGVAILASGGVQRPDGGRGPDRLLEHDLASQAE